jgi:hypothetical protein
VIITAIQNGKAYLQDSTTPPGTILPRTSLLSSSTLPGSEVPNRKRELDLNKAERALDTAERNSVYDKIVLREHTLDLEKAERLCKKRRLSYWNNTSESRSWKGKANGEKHGLKMLNRIFSSKRTNTSLSFIQLFNSV